MRSHVNIRLLAVVVFLGLALGVSVFFLHRHQMREHAKFFLEQAQTAKEQIDQFDDPKDRMDQFLVATKAYDNYFSLAPDDLDALAENAIMFADFGTSLAEQRLHNEAVVFLARAMGKFENVLRQSPDRPELRRRLIKLLFETGQFSSVVDHCKFLCVMPKDVDALRKLFDKYNLWERLPDHDKSSTRLATDDLSGLMEFNKRSVDEDKLFRFLGDDMWMLLEGSEILDLLGQSLWGLNKPEAAVKPFEKAIILAPTELGSYGRLAKLLHFMLDRPKDADYWITELVDSNPDSARAYYMRGDYRKQLIRVSPREEATRLADEALQDATKSISKAIEQTAEQADRQFPGEEATESLKAAFDDASHEAPKRGGRVTPAYRKALLLAARRARAYEKAHGLDAEESKESADYRDGLLLAAECVLISRYLLDEPAEDPLEVAREYTQTAVELFPNNPTAYEMLAKIEQRAGRPDKAVEWLERGLEIAEGNVNLLWRLAGLLIRQGQVDEARATIEKMVQAGASGMLVTYLTAQIDLVQGRWLAASKGFEKIRDELRPWPDEARRADCWLAKCYEQLGQHGKQRDAFLRAASHDRTWVPALMGIAKTKAQSGQLDEAIADYRLIIQLKNAPPVARVKLARLLVQRNLETTESKRNWDEVEEALDQAAKAVPDSVDVTIMRAELLVARKQTDEAARLLADAKDQVGSALRQLRDQRRSKLEEAENLSGKAREKALDEAEELKSAARVKKATEIVLWSALINVTQVGENWAETEKTLEMARHALGDTVTLRLTQARYLARRYGEEAAEQIRALAEATDRFSEEEQLWLWRELARLSFRVHDREQTLRLCRLVLDREPGNLDMQTLRLQLATFGKDASAMQEILDEIKRSEQKPGPLWYWGEAQRLKLLATDGGSELLVEAQKHLTRAEQLRPKWWRVKLLAAEIFDVQGNEDLAIENYLAAIDLGAIGPYTIRRVARLLSKQGRFREASNVFQLLEGRRMSLSSEAGREMRDVTAISGDYQKALELARQVAADSDDYRDHVWLGQILRMTGQYAKAQGRTDESDKALAEAEQALRHATNLAPEALETWVALIQFLARCGRKADAETSLTQMLSKIPPDKTAIAQAQCYEVMGEREQAVKQYEAAIEKAPNDAAVACAAARFFFRTNQPARGEEQLSRILDGRMNADGKTKAWARRALASILFARGGEEHIEKALVLIEENLAADPSSAPDLYIKAIISAARAGGKGRREAIPALEKLVAKQESPPPELLFNLATLYMEEGQWDKFKERMRQLVGDYGNEPRYVAAFAKALIERKELQEAEVWLKQLEQIAPEDFLTVRLRARFEMAHRRYTLALIALKRYLEGPAATDSDRANRLLRVAASMEELAEKLRQSGQNTVADTFSDEAETVYREYVEGRPGAELLMAGFLARQGRFGDAMKLTEEQWASCKPEMIATTCFVLLKAANGRPEAIQRVDMVLQAALKKYEQSTILLIAKAVLRGYQGRYEETEAIYRAILKKNPTNLTVMNNLALFLALEGKKPNEALRLVQRALRQVGPVPVLLDTRAVVRLALGQPDKALDDLKTAIEDAPTALRYFHQAQAYYQLGQKKDASDALKMAHKRGLKEGHLDGAERRAYRKLRVVLK